MGQTLLEYAAQYLTLPSAEGITSASLIDGSEENISNARYILHDGLEDFFSGPILEHAIPLLVLNCLCVQEQAELVSVVSKDDTELAVRSLSLRHEITVSDIAKGKYIEALDFDEPPSVVELALESYDDIRRLMARVRTTGGLGE